MSFHNWKEVLSAALVAGMVYTSYFVLIPKLLYRKKRFLFWVSILLLLLGIVVAELLLVNSDMHARARWLTDSQFKAFYYTSFVLLMFRDATFFVIFFLIKLYRTHAIVIENIRQEASKSANMLLVTSSEVGTRMVNFKDIAYFTYQDSETIVILKNGEQLLRDGYLSDVEKLIPQEEWVRPNRQTLVMRESIVRYTSVALYVRVKEEDMAIPYYSTKRNEIIQALKAWNKDLYAAAEEMAMDYLMGLDLPEEAKRILEYIGNHPGANMQQVADELHYSLRTAQRRIAELRQKGLVERQNPSQKSSGYRVADGK